MDRIQSVLLIEDDPEFRTRLSSLLRNGGFQTTEATTIAEGLRQADSQRPSVILVDMVFATGSGPRSSGVEMLRTIRDSNPDVPVVAISRHMVDAKTITEDLGQVAWIDKSSAMSASPLDLIAAIKRISESARDEPNERSEDKEATADTQPRDVSGGSFVELSTIDLFLYQQLQRHPELLKSLDWRLFERLLADILETFGYRVELMQGTKDGGIDIVAFGRANEMGSHKYLLQAKRWANSVGVEPVQRLLFLQSHEKATKSCLATTGHFTRGAWRLAEQYEWQLSLRDYAGLQEWIAEALSRKLTGLPWRESL